MKKIDRPQAEVKEGMKKKARHETFENCDLGYLFNMILDFSD